MTVTGVSRLIGKFEQCKKIFECPNSCGVQITLDSVRAEVLTDWLYLFIYVFIYFYKV